MLRLSLALLVLVIPSGLAQGAFLASPHARICGIDSDGDGSAGGGDPLFLMAGPCGAGPAAGDVRLTASAGFPGGSIVSGTDQDTGRTALPVAVAYGFVDGDGDGSHALGDEVFLHFGSLPGRVQPGDVVLGGQGAFEAINSGDPRVGHPLLVAVVAVGAESYAERDGTPGFSLGDHLYLDMDGSGAASIGDLRLAVGWPSSSSQMPSTISPGPSPSGNLTPTASPSAAGTPTNDTEGKPAPGPTVAVAGGCLGLLAILARRRF